MAEKAPIDRSEAKTRLARFLAGGTDDHVFRHPTCHPSHPTGFCCCDKGHVRALWFYLRATVQSILLALPFDRPKVWFLRRLGARIGNNVHISAGVWIDPMFPQLLTFEDDVFIGVGAKIATHEFRIGEFRAGKVILRKGALIGGYAVLGCGIEIGEYATIAAGAVVGRDVRARATAIGNPARIVPGNDGAMRTQDRQVTTEY
jgi:acetyltransferase-like isoleucine patch superfamily enzyme